MPLLVDFDGNVPLATLAHTMVVNYLEGGAKLLDMVIEAEENLTGSPPGTMLANFHYAMRHQCMTFTGGMF